MVTRPPYCAAGQTRVDRSRRQPTATTTTTGPTETTTAESPGTTTTDPTEGAD